MGTDFDPQCIPVLPFGLFGQIATKHDDGKTEEGVCLSKADVDATRGNERRNLTITLRLAPDATTNDILQVIADEHTSKDLPSESFARHFFRFSTQQAHRILSAALGKKTASCWPRGFAAPSAAPANGCQFEGYGGTSDATFGRETAFDVVLLSGLDLRTTLEGLLNRGPEALQCNGRYRSGSLDCHRALAHGVRSYLATNPRVPIKKVLQWIGAGKKEEYEHNVLLSIAYLRDPTSTANFLVTNDEVRRRVSLTSLVDQIRARGGDEHVLLNRLPDLVARLRSTGVATIDDLSALASVASSRSELPHLNNVSYYVAALAIAQQLARSPRMSDAQYAQSVANALHVAVTQLENVMPVAPFERVDEDITTITNALTDANLAVLEAQVVGEKVRPFQELYRAIRDRLLVGMEKCPECRFAPLTTLQDHLDVLLTMHNTTANILSPTRTAQLIGLAEVIIDTVRTYAINGLAELAHTGVARLQSLPQKYPQVMLKRPEFQQAIATMK